MVSYDKNMINIRTVTVLKKRIESVEFSKEEAVRIFMEGINGFTDDCFADGRELNVLLTEREDF